VFVDGRVKDPGVVGAHARTQEVKCTNAITDLVFMGSDEVGIVFVLALFVP
jgi:hypothetical protein